MSAFTEYSPIVVRGLESLSQLHPFIGVATKAFSLVITMNLTRINNNKKVIALKMQMQDTMMILFDLRHMKDPDHIDAEGNTMENRMSDLLKKLSQDITEAGSACDHYMKKSFVAKTLKSLKYEARLAGFGDKFVEHRKSLKLALSIHTALGVDTANTKLDNLSAQTENLQFTMGQILKKLDTPREKEGKEFIEKQGGPMACLKDGRLLQELIDISGDSVATINARRIGDKEKDLEAARKKLLLEYSEDLDQALKKNLTVFERKMEMQYKQMETFFQETLHNEGLFIISAIKAGAHDKIIDPDMQTLWKDNEWKGSVKARTFVLALQEFIADKLTGQETIVLPMSPVEPLTAVSMVSVDLSVGQIFKDDHWALKYIDVSRVQPILEAIDDDGTGFISIKEVNTFVGSKPDGWSLPVWIAYWAAGWHADMVRYKRKIHAIVRKMYQVLDYDTIAGPSNESRNLPANRYSLDEYMYSEPFTRIDLLLRSLQPRDPNVDDTKLKHIIDVYSSSEEVRLQENLESVAYDIDTPGTVALVTGPGRIERFILPLLYLLLKRHLKAFYLARTHILDPEEFWDFTASLQNVFMMLDDRIGSLGAIFKQTVPDVSNRLSNFAFGLLQLSYGEQGRNPKQNSLRPWNEDGRVAVVESEDMSAEEIAAIPLDTLKYGVRDTLESQIYQHSLATFHPQDQTLQHPLSGYWAGHFWIKDPEEFYSVEGLFQMSITNVDQEGNVTGAAEGHHGLVTASGKISPDDTLSLKLIFEDGVKLACQGQLSPAAGTLTGKFTFMGPDQEEEVNVEKAQVEDNDTTGDTQNPQTTYTFFFNRTPAFAWRFHGPFDQPSRTARERWAFAISAVIDQVQRMRCSWYYLKARNAERRKFLDLTVRQSVDLGYLLTPSDPLTGEEKKQLHLLAAQIHPTDARFYSSLINSLVNAKSVMHLGYSCDSCNRIITHTRFICLTCISDDFATSFDLCLNCRDNSTSTDKFNHNPSHAMIKVERVMQDGLLGWAVPEGREVASRVKELLRSKNSSTKQTATDDVKDGRPDKLKRAETLCCCCNKEVDAPCWVCLFCSPDTYICDTCEKERTPVLADGPGKWHEHKDHLIRIHDTEEIIDHPSVESRLNTLEGKLATVETRLESFEAMLKQILVALVPSERVHSVIESDNNVDLE
ncbi:hypothetical protein GYMLUDRAFT_416337 [Collybiopsis luxurians FD-317 M1]|nr:hypothetical protein GYMLUDRAFT_416337 [Collybiopsis luxurians FD-317 M1]